MLKLTESTIIYSIFYVGAWFCVFVIWFIFCHRHSYRQFFECLYLQAAAGEICYQPSVRPAAAADDRLGALDMIPVSKLFFAARQVPLL